MKRAEDVMEIILEMLIVFMLITTIVFVIGHLYSPRWIEKSNEVVPRYRGCSYIGCSSTYFYSLEDAVRYQQGVPSIKWTKVDYQHPISNNKFSDKLTAYAIHGGQ
jgi:hypothetical protein